MSFHENGFAIVNDVVSSPKCDDLIANVASIAPHSAGSRSLVNRPWCRHLAGNIRKRLASEIDLPVGAVAVQCTYFHKSSEQNWLVAWHQDRSVPVHARVSSDELTGWSQKEGMTFVHAPDALLAEMVAVRLHLDNSTEQNGPLRIIPGSHRRGTLSPTEIERFCKESSATTCAVPKGGVLVMRPLLLHASSKSTTTDPRRVLHFLFAPPQLPHGLRWRDAV